MKSNANPMETFAFDFGHGIRCAARIDVARLAGLPTDQLPACVHFDWHGAERLTAGLWPRYLAWIKTVWQSVADKAGKSLLCCFAPPGAAPFAIVFEPGKPCEQAPLPLGKP